MYEKNYHPFFVLIVRHTILFLVIGVCLQAQPVSSVSVTKYSQLQGLFSYNIKQILKDKNGFLWIAAQDGLQKFDGHTFYSYTKNADIDHKICAADVRKIIEDTVGHKLWVLPSDLGFHAIDILTGNVVQTVKIPKKDSSDWNITMSSCRNRLWIGSFSGLKIYDIGSEKFINAPNPDKTFKNEAASFEIRCIKKDEYNNMWVCYSGFGIVIYKGNDFRKIKEIPLCDLGLNSKGENMRFYDCASTNNGCFVFATSQGLRRIRYTKEYMLSISNTPVPETPLLNFASVSCIANIRDSFILVGASSGLFKLDMEFRHVSRLRENLAPAESDWFSSVQNIFCDKDDLIWLGCMEGMAVYNGNHIPFEKYFYDPVSKNEITHFTSIGILENNDMLIGMQNGLMKIEKETQKFDLIEQQHLYIHILQYKTNLFFFFRDDGIYVINNSKLTPVSSLYPEFKPYQSYSINSHLSLGDTAFLLGTENDNGILLWNFKKHSIRKIYSSSQPALGADVVNNIFKDKNGRIWVLSDNLITIIDKELKNSRILDFAGNKKYTALNLFFDMCQLGDDYYIASYGNGIIKLDKNYSISALFTTKDGLSNDGVYNIFNTSDSLLAITTNNGLSVFNIHSKKFKNYFAEDGLHSNAFEEVASTYYNGKIYAGGINGFTIIDPSKFTTNTTPPLFYFTNIKINTTDSTANTDTSNLEINSIHIPNNWLQATISFTGINYSNPARVTYQYRITEKDSNWINQGAQNFITLIGLKPGTYHVQVKASNEDGYWSNPKTLIIYVEPHWYETLLFKIAVAFAAVGLFYAFYRYRINQFKKQQEIRQSIASDLHDDIGATLNSIKLYTYMAQKSADKESYLLHISNSLTQAATGLRDMIWVLSNTGDTLSDLVYRLHQFTDPLAAAQNINIEINNGVGNEYLLSKTEKRNILLVIKESINNSIKYSDCKNINIQFVITGKKICITIKDDGCGFDLNNYTPGNGLNNMQQRAVQMHYHIQITSSAGAGTSISLEGNVLKNGW